jgi:alcohol dehydrogenase YqhD (iron-dependent ADH family)
MEFYFLGTNQEITISIDEAIINTLIKSIDRLLADEKDYNARANLAWSSAMALNGISGASMRGGDWAVHNIEHSISVLYPDVAHAEGLAVIFPAWILYMQENNKQQFERWARNIWGVDRVDKGVEIMKNKFISWGAPVSLRDLHLQKENIPELAANAMIRGEFGILKKLNYNDVINILELAF